MSYILQIETATASCSVAISLNGETIAVKEENNRNIHAGSLTVFIQECLRQANLNIKEIDAVAVSKGPGSYTGLRIGVSTAKGICYALDKPLIAINTLKAMTNGFLAHYFSVDNHILFCPMIDARRMEVYCAVFDKQLIEISATEAKIIDEESFSDLLKEHIIYFFGDGALKCEAAFAKQKNARIMDDFLNSAANMSGLAFECFKQQKFENSAYFEPYYLKEFIALKSKT